MTAMHRFHVGHLAMLAAMMAPACNRDKTRSPRSHDEVRPPGAIIYDADSGAYEGDNGMTPASRPGEPRRIQPRDPLARADDDMKRVLQAMDTLKVKPISTLTPDEARTQATPADAVKRVLEQNGKAYQPTPMERVEDRKIPGAEGELDVRIYTPKTKDKKPLPVIVYWHGGGFVIAGLDAYDASPRALAEEADAIVVSADYRRAPENKFPAAHDDAVAAYKWVVSKASSFGGDPKRIAVAGESAGGNLAANVALAARDRNLTRPVHALLVYPVAQTDMTTASYLEWANARPLDKSAMKWFVEKYTRTPEDAKDPRLNLIAADFKDFPPTTIVLAEIDPLRTDGELLEKRLDAAGVKVGEKTYEGVTHEFFGMGAAVADAKDAEEWAASRLKDAFER
jgi:acetyl esterase/lipase